MKRFLITPSLHSAWQFYNLLDGKSKQDFLDTLNKKEIEKTEAMQDGIDFEADVLRACGPEGFDGDDGYADSVCEVAQIVRGGIWQERVMREIRLGGMDFLLYGKADVIKRNWIYDIKRTANYDTGKYKGSVQHPIYMFCSGIENFAYLISDGRSVWREDYFYSRAEEDRMRGELSDMVSGIMSDPEFRQAYTTHWQTRDSKMAA